MPNRDQYRLTEEQHQAIFEQLIKPALFTGTRSVERPIAIIFGGQPGSGKSAAVDVAKGELASHGNAVEIIGDDIRSLHPQYVQLMGEDDKTAAFYTDGDTGRWVEKAIAEAKARRVNVVIEGTMRDSDKVAVTMTSLRSAGYVIDARVLAVNARLSEQGILQRYEGQKADRGAGRMTTPEAHQAAYEGLLNTLDRIERDKLADRVTIYRRGAEVINTIELEKSQEPQARAVVEAERARPMTISERRDYAQGFDKLADMLAKPSRQASAEERQQVADLQRQAHAMVAAEVFRHEQPEKAIQQYPELARAYEVMRSFEGKAGADGLGAEKRDFVITRMREYIASSIERGHVPDAQLIAKTQAKDIGREPGR